MPDDRGRVLVGKNAEDDVHRTALGKQRRKRGRRSFIMRAVDPGLVALCKQAVFHFLKARGPVGASEPFVERRTVDLEPVLSLQHCPGKIGVTHLKCAGHGRLQGVIERPVAIFQQQRRAILGGDPGNRTFDRRWLRQQNEWHAQLRDARFFGGNAFDPVAEEPFVIDPDIRNAADERAREDVRRIEPAAEPDFDHAGIGLVPREGEEGRGGRCLEKAGANVGAYLANLAQQSRQFGVVDQRSRNPDPLIEADEVRACKGVNSISGSFQARAKEGAGRPLAVGSGDVEDRGQTILRPPERIEQRDIRSSPRISMPGESRSR